MATAGNKYTEEELPTVTGEPTDQLSPEEDLEDLDADNADESYEGIQQNDEDEDLVDDNMTEMPVVPSPS
ncbi:MAG: hypothetical protein EOP41_09015 [Sphingobacteriaceae bacterium]|nr:MAG: hypothetical protein EOP41_09015 [Sphingobacteriaceae bacterium]